MKKLFIFPLIIILSLSLIRCKKVGNVTPVQQSYTTNYDSVNNIFRVKVSSSGVPFTVTLKEKIPGSASGVYNVQTGMQSSGAAFEYPFTPAAGDSVKIIAQSNKPAIYVYALYRGVLLGNINVQTTSSGGSYAEFDFLVPN